MESIIHFLASMVHGGGPFSYDGDIKVEAVIHCSADLDGLQVESLSVNAVLPMDLGIRQKATQPLEWMQSKELRELQVPPPPPSGASWPVPPPGHEASTPHLLSTAMKLLFPIIAGSYSGQKTCK